MGVSGRPQLLFSSPWCPLIHGEGGLIGWIKVGSYGMPDEMIKLRAHVRHAPD